MPKTKACVAAIIFSVVNLNLPALSQAKMVISQIYGGAGCGTPNCSTYKNDYIEIFNAGNAAQDLSGWAVQYTAASGTAWQVTALTSINLQPGKYYLIAEGTGANGANNIPTPDVSGVIAMSATSAKIALTNTTVPLSGTCPVSTAIVDFVGMGIAATCREGANASSPSTTTALLRAGNGCTDINNNSTDFTVTTPAPRNTAATASACSTLPVVFLSYNAQYQPADNTVVLSWITSLEQDASKFVVERSRDGSLWDAIDEVAAVGNSNHENRYQAKDPHPHRGANYYRIKQVDIDGSFTYTRVFTVDTYGQARQFTISPNPTNGAVLININIATNRPVSIQVADMNGKVLLKERHVFNAAQPVRVEMKQFGKGTYFISLLADEINSTEKIVVY